MGEATAKKTIIKMATLVPEGTDWHGMLVELGQRWKEATNGQIVLRIYPGGVVGDERDMIRKMRIGNQCRMNSPKIPCWINHQGFFQ